MNSEDSYCSVKFKPLGNQSLRQVSERSTVGVPVQTSGAQSLFPHLQIHNKSMRGEKWEHENKNRRKPGKGKDIIKGKTKTVFWRDARVTLPSVEGYTEVSDHVIYNTLPRISIGRPSESAMHLMVEFRLGNRSLKVSQELSVATFDPLSGRLKR